jgi:hypothetical protein
MSARAIISQRATRANLDLAMETTEPHLRPIIKAVRDHGVDMVFATQDTDAFRLPRTSNPAIIILGDDFDCAMGPEGFHLPSIRRAIRAVHSFAVVSSAAQPDVYTAIALTSVATRRNTMLVETRPEQEIQWVNLIRKLAPGRMVCLATVAGGHA